MNFCKSGISSDVQIEFPGQARYRPGLTRQTAHFATTKTTNQDILIDEVSSLMMQ